MTSAAEHQYTEFSIQNQLGYRQFLPIPKLYPNNSNAATLVL